MVSPAELFGLDGRTVVLTGAGGVLGRAMATAVLDAGARLVAVGRAGRVSAAAREWAAGYGADRVALVEVDLADPAALDAALDRIAATERVDVLVNNAHQLDHASGFGVPAGGFDGLDFAQWQAHLDGGLWWAARCAQRLKAPLHDARGAIVNVASMYGVVAPSPRLYEGTDKTNPTPYSVSKAGLLALTRYIAAQWGPAGVRANALAPGAFSDVGGAGENSVASDDPFLARLHERTLLGRTGRPDELAGPLLFLCSDASSYLTGHALVVDGGWTVT